MFGSFALKAKEFLGKNRSDRQYPANVRQLRRCNLPDLACLM